jgi:hypothetical protein
MTSTLNDLKTQIQATLSISKLRGAPIVPENQRLFYLGRELKSGSRKLSDLMGGHKRFSKILHLHTKQPKVENLLNDDDQEENDDIVPVVNKGQQEIVVLDDSDDDDDEIIVLDDDVERASKRSRVV